MYSRKEIKYILLYLLKLPWYELKKFYRWLKDELSWFNKSQSISKICLFVSIIAWLREMMWVSRIFLLLCILFYVKSEIAKGLWKHIMRKEEEKNGK